jgi:hypothetical protein
MINQSIPPLIDFFKHIKDPRVERNKAYPLLVGSQQRKCGLMGGPGGPRPPGGALRGRAPLRGAESLSLAPGCRQRGDWGLSVPPPPEYDSHFL